MPLVSVGIATYNRPDSLRKALESIVNQTYTNLEILISEDCTPCAETKAVLREYAERDARIKCFHQQTNLGPPRNIRFVLEQTSGEYFMWADDDDVRDLRWVETLLAKFADADTVVALGVVSSVNSEDKVVSKLDSLQFCGPRLLRLIKYFMAEERDGKSNIVCGLFRTDFLRSIKHWSQYRHNRYGGGDYLFVLDCVQHGNIVVDPSVTVYKRLPVYDPEFLRKGPKLPTRALRQLMYFLDCVSVVNNWMDKALLLSLIPVRIASAAMFQAGLYGLRIKQRFRIYFGV